MISDLTRSRAERVTPRVASAPRTARYAVTWPRRDLLCFPRNQKYITKISLAHGHPGEASNLQVVWRVRSRLSGESRIIFLPERSSICQYRLKLSAINVKQQSRARLLLTHPVLYILKIRKTYGAFWKPPFQNQPKSVRL